MTTSDPEYHSHDEFKLRSQKLADIRRLGINPYPHKYSPQNKTKELHDEFDSASIGHSEEAAAGSTKPTSIAGRLVLFRSMGKNAFGHIQDDTGRLQVMFNKDITKIAGYEMQGDNPEALTPMKFLEKKIDLGDIIGVEGFLFHTNKGELTRFVHTLTLLCKIAAVAAKRGPSRATSATAPGPRTCGTPCAFRCRPAWPTAPAFASA